MDANPTATTEQELDMYLSIEDLNPNSERDERRSKELAVIKGLANLSPPHPIITELQRLGAQGFSHSLSQFTISLSVIKLQSSSQAPQCKGKT